MAALALVVVGVAACLSMVPALGRLRDGPALLPAVGGLTALGCILALGCLLAVWLAWGDAPFGRRLFQHWLVATGLCVLWLVGLFRGNPTGPEVEAVGITVAMTVPVISLATQFPLWVMRQLFGWRLVRAANDVEASAERPWTIRDLLLATLIVSVAVGIGRLSPAFLNNQDDFGGAWVAGGIAAFVITCITILPSAVMLLRVEPFWRGVVYSLVYAFSYEAVLWVSVAVIYYNGLTPLPPYQALVGISCLILAFAHTVILAATVARLLGYRLITRSLRTKAAWTLHPAR